MARYDYGLRGYRETARRRRGEPWHLQSWGEDPRDRPEAHRYARGDWWPDTPRVSEPYNRDYVVDDPGERYPINYNPYAGDTPWRNGDYSRFEPPYMTPGGSRTYRGARRMGWEGERGRFAGPYRRPWPRGWVDDYRPDGW